MILLRSAARSPLFTAYASYGFRFGNKQVVYIARQSAILFYQFCLSVRLSNAGIVCKQVDISSHFLLTFWRHSSFSTPPPYRRCKIPRRTPSAEALNVQGWENCANIGLYLENGTRLAHGYYGTLIESHRWPIDLCRFQ